MPIELAIISPIVISILALIAGKLFTPSILITITSVQNDYSQAYPEDEIISIEIDPSQKFAAIQLVDKNAFGFVLQKGDKLVSRRYKCDDIKCIKKKNGKTTIRFDDFVVPFLQLTNTSKAFDILAKFTDSQKFSVK